MIQFHDKILHYKFDKRLGSKTGKAKAATQPTRTQGTLPKTGCQTFGILLVLGTISFLRHSIYIVGESLGSNLSTLTMTRRTLWGTTCESCYVCGSCPLAGFADVLVFTAPMLRDRNLCCTLRDAHEMAFLGQVRTCSSQIPHHHGERGLVEFKQKHTPCSLCRSS